MSPDRVAFIHSILTSEDLTIGISTGDARRPYTFAGGGNKIGVTRHIAWIILSAFETYGGPDAPETIMLRKVLDLGAIVAKGGAS